jgi:NitT/TauT family transport system substrate-binding protein
MRTRPILTALVAAGALLAGCGSDTEATSSPNITLGLVQGQDFIHAMPARVAESQGLFTNAGLKVSVVDFTAGSDLTKAMSGGSVNVGAATGLDSVSAVAHGVDLQSFFGVYTESPMALIVPKDSAITSFAELAGKKVGISKAGSMTDYVTRAALDAAKVPLTDVKEVPLGAPDTTMAGLGRGDVDAIVLPVNFAYILEANGTGKLAQTVADATSGTDQFAVLMADKAYLSANKDNVRKLASAYTKAIGWMKQHKDETVDLAVQKLGMDPAVAAKTYDALMPNFTEDGKINTGGLADYAKALESLGIASTTPDEGSYLDTTIVANG